ncbi:MAG: hypothetical protein WDZ91_03275 [Paenibacillaceae bacterium]
MISNDSQKLRPLLSTMDDLFDDFFPWLAGQYDPQSGGFYYARSSMNSEFFKPDIESTAQSLNILERQQLLGDMSDQMKNEMIRFFQNKQNPNTGYFLDEHPAMIKDEVMVHRAINYSTGSLRKLGSEALYPLPLAAQAAPDYIRTPESYLAKWQSIDLRNSWRGCDRLASSCTYIGQMSEADRAPFLQEAVRYLASIQDPNTGLWGEGSLYVRISGTFKLHTFYSGFGIPMPNTDLICNSVLHCLRNEVASDMCYIRNPIDLLSYIQAPLTVPELTEVLEITTRNMTMLRRADGGFSREIDHSPPAPNVAQVKKGDYYPDMPEPVPLSQGLYEGDVNASTQATLIRRQVYRLAGCVEKPLEGSSDFYKIIV